MGSPPRCPAFVRPRALPPPTGETAALAAIAVLVGVIAWFLRREIRNNDGAHQELRADIRELRGDVKKLLAGDVAWVQALLKLK